MIYSGVIYGYARPDGSLFYVGQSSSLKQRHGQHLRGPLPVDDYLRSLGTVPEPIELRCVSAEDRAELIDELAHWETVLMFQHHTLISCFPNNGGWNFTFPRSSDYLKMGQMNGARVKSRGEGFCNRELAVKAGRVGGVASGNQHKENDTGVCAPGVAAKGGRVGGMIGGKIGGPIGSHNRWHRDRDIVNPKCVFCKGI